MTLSLSRTDFSYVPPVWVGILNLTPDSFSDGGLYATADAALRQFEALVHAGAGVVDIGAESTRPHAVPLTPSQEWDRLAPVLNALAQHPLRGRVRVSVDTRHAATAFHALACGADIINDVEGLRDPQMRAVLAASDCDIIAMHALTVPVDPAVVWGPEVDPLQEILRWKATLTAQAEASGIAADRLIYDVGLGFGKNPQQSLTLVQCADACVASGGRWLYGHSRKSFLKLFGEGDQAVKDALTLAFSVQLAKAGVGYLRVHNVAVHQDLWEGVCT